MDSPSHLAVLEQSPLVKFLDKNDMEQLLSGGTVRRLHPNEILFEEGASENSMFVVLSGKLEVYRKNRGIAVRVPGDFLGEMALLESKPRSASVRAIMRAEVLEIKEEVFNSRIASNPKMVWEMVKILSERCREELDVIDWGFGELRKSEDRYQKIVQSVSDIILQVSPRQTIEFANDSVRGLGYDPMNLIGQPIENLVDTEYEDISWTQLLTRRVGPRSTVNLEVFLKANESSVVYDLYRGGPYLVNATGLWNVPNELVLRRDTNVEFLGTLWIARQQKLEFDLNH